MNRDIDVNYYNQIKIQDKRTERRTIRFLTLLSPLDMKTYGGGGAGTYTHIYKQAHDYMPEIIYP